MRRCDWFIFQLEDEPDDRNRCPTGPLRDTEQLEPFRCHRCGGWTPHGALPSIERANILARETASLVAKLAEDYAWAHSVAFAPTRRGSNGRAPGHSDPTGNGTANTKRQIVKDYTTIAARLLERAVRALRSADEAIGDALFAAEPPGPVDHTPAPYHEPIPANRPDLEDAHAAQHRRQARGEGTPT